jgi:hypothetical protein
VRGRVAAVVAGCVLALGAPVAATHAPDHRFIVLGFVTDAEGRGLANVPVVVRRLKTGLAYRTRTEADGFYLVVVHLHDEDAGDPLQLGANGVTGDVSARYDVGDRKTERGTRVDVRGDALVEDRVRFAETLRAFLSR